MKKIFAILICVAMLVAMTACGGGVPKTITDDYLKGTWYATVNPKDLPGMEEIESLGINIDVDVDIKLSMEFDGEGNVVTVTDEESTKEFYTKAFEGTEMESMLDLMFESLAEELTSESTYTIKDDTTVEIDGSDFEYADGKLTSEGVSFVKG